MPAPRQNLPPWRAWLSENQAVILSPARELSLGVLLALAQQPAIVRSARFVEAAQTWLSERAAVSVDQDAPRIAPSLPQDLPAEIAPSSPAAPTAEDDEIAPTPLQPSAETGLERVSQWRYEADIEEDTHAVAPPVTGEIPDWPDVVHAPAPEQEVPGLSSSLEPIHITTEFGGIFYLLNAALALALYGDFTQALSHGLTLSPWDFLALMGTEFIGADFEADPIWPLLAHLSGRGDKPPGHDFDAPDTWHVPPEWLEPFEETALLWEHADHLRVWHSAGFWLIDAPEGNPPEMAVSGVVPVPQSSEGLARWREWLAAYLGARLRVALDLEDDADLAPTLFAHTAHIAVTPACVDITLNLTTLPIAIRYAGLDRDPGWIPAAGYAVAFRFEV